MTEGPEAIDIGLRLLVARRRKGWSQVWLARTLGLDPSLISRWERGIVSPTALQLVSVCRILEIDPGTVLAPGTALPNRVA